MSNDNETPDETPDSMVTEGVDPDELEGLEGLEVDPDALTDGDDDDSPDDVLDVDVVDGSTDDSTEDGAAPPTADTSPTDDERLHLDDSEEDERPRRKRRDDDDDENELATADDQEEDLLKILEDKLRTTDDFAPEGEEATFEAEDGTDGTPLIQPRRPDEDHCQQCFLLVRKSAPKCPVDHDLCPKFPVA